MKTISFILAISLLMVSLSIAIDEKIQPEELFKKPDEDLKKLYIDVYNQIKKEGILRIDTYGIDKLEKIDDNKEYTEKNNEFYTYNGVKLKEYIFTNDVSIKQYTAK